MQRLAKLGIEFLLQASSCSQQSGFHRLTRNLENLSGFLDAQSIDIAQHEDDPEGLWQIRYGFLEKLCDLASRGIGFRR